MVSCPKANITEIERKNMQIAGIKEERAKKAKLDALDKTAADVKEDNQQKLDKLTQKALDSGKDFVIRETRNQDGAEQMKRVQDPTFEADFDEDEVPPLE